MPQVIIEQPSMPPMTVPLSGDEIHFGRSEKSDVVLTADEVSRNHAKLCRRGDKMVLVDLKSLNGTYVNRQRIVERVLSHLDEIWFGSKCRLIYRDDTQFGRHTSEGGGRARPSDSKLLQNMDKIRAEMDQVGNSMTLISRMGTAQPLASAAEASTLSVSAEDDDVKRMSRAYRRMAALHKASQVMTSNFDLERRLSDVLDLSLEILNAHRGFVMLREGDSNQLNVRIARQMGQELCASSPSMGIAGRAAIDGEPVLMSDQSTDKEFGMRDSIIRSRITSAMCVPLKLENRVLGSIYIDTRNPDVSFSEEDLELFSSLASQAALAIDNVQLHQRMVEEEKKRQNLCRFLPTAVADKVLQDDSAIVLGGQKTIVTTLFCDIRGSTQLAEQVEPHEMVEMLNEHFTAMTDIVFKHNGTLDKYIGDEIMAIFGAPLSSKEDAINAIYAALEIQERNQELNALRRHEKRPELHVGIGIDTGEVIAGYIGSPTRMDFTVVGDRVNTAKRFCDMAAAGKIVAGYETCYPLQDRILSHPIGAQQLKGKEALVEAYEIIAVKPDRIAKTEKGPLHS